KDIYYPPEVKATDWLTYYSRQFSIAEINTSFYHTPKHQSVLNWMANVPDHFRFCPKLSRYITHMKKLIDPEEPLARFFDVFEPMQPRMGPVLTQLPPSLKWNYDRAEHLYGVLKKLYAPYEFVLEVRHATWLESDSLNLMAQYEIGLVISQSAGVFPYSEMVTAKNVYLRFHGPAALYASPYSDEDLAYYAAKIKDWVTDGHAVWAFFNNDIHGHAFRDAARLKAQLGQ
ncbi:MAG TPA: DUF72 domain-containing protein, partial [Chitinophagaceae bacterium]|nr:DUF72 domain-containing protein [Chitinophagaceae bacterium]